MNIRKVTWMKPNASNVSIPTAYPAADAATAVGSQPRGDASRRASRASLRTKRAKSQSKPTTPAVPVSSSEPSHWLSRMHAFARSPVTIRVPNP